MYLEYKGFLGQVIISMGSSIVRFRIGFSMYLDIMKFKG